jgi:hypothetical protein
MARIPVPERGQPLDLSYIYQLASAVNDLSDEMSTNSYNYLTIDTPTAGRQSVKTAEGKVIGGYVEVATSSTVSAGNEQEFSYNFEDFKYAPIVTATPVNVGNTAAGKDVSVIIKSTTTSSVTGVVRYNTAGDLSLAVNLIIIGVPTKL